eukprot:CAMPEP_0195098584 /NCGR_PEP_ID=MMETSP0448-20130528/57757_1 /TAXON_ID=66468 /ORGANISM="Heterocapsa triquestra, Strain CCMP 448" /LENGTH=47 /DNA_ID= /DNA_START= /DNA_END= /DNA_ORIENTATION=
MAPRSWSEDLRRCARQAWLVSQAPNGSASRCDALELGAHALDLGTHR